MTRLRLVEGRARQTDLASRGWRLARRPGKAGSLQKEMLSLMRSSKVRSVGLAGEVVLQSDGSFIEAGGEVSHVMMERGSRTVLELGQMFPEIELDTVEKSLESHNRCVERTVDHLLTLSLSTSSSSSSTSSSSSLSPAEPLCKPLPPCPECPVCYEPFTPPRRIFQVHSGEAVTRERVRPNCSVVAK